MRTAFFVLAFVFAVLAFVFPPLFMAAVVCALIAIGCSPGGAREDGKRRTGGLLGGVWDSAVVNMTMRECPHCLSKIPADASKCRHCAERL